MYNLALCLWWLVWAVHYQDHEEGCPKGCVYKGTSNARELRSLYKRGGK